MHIIQNYIHQLINNIEKPVKQEKINLIMDGGIFNGSYLVGALYFLQEMEKQEFISIKKISSCSISSVCALLYYIDALDIAPDLYEIMVNQVRKKHNLDAFIQCFDKIKDRISDPELLCKRLYHKLYISYYNISKGKKVVKSSFRDLNDILQTIYKSCFIPFIVNGDLLYKQSFCDGINPYLFPKSDNCRRLYINLMGYDKIQYILSIKNEKTNMHRILAGLLDIHLFIIKGSSTQMCSYMEQWSILQILYHRCMRPILETLLFILIYTFYILHCYIFKITIMNYKKYKYTLL
uniref:PNPLA domain-containing protein n=1 Tax=viral metagenome TaxID=1070528 RepID=A0A6C0B0B2_9ZZZZ